MRGHFLRAAATGVNRRTAILSTATTATLAYIAAVEGVSGDNQRLEDGVLAAMVTFANWRIPLGGACCLMTGPRTLAGALVPMVGPAPTGVNLVAGDYNRSRVQLDGISKRITFPFDNQDALSGTQNNRHAAGGLSAATVFTSQQYLFSAGADGTGAVGRDTYRFNIAGTSVVTSASSGFTVVAAQPSPLPAGLSGVFRDSEFSYQAMDGGSAPRTVTQTSNPPDADVNWTFGSRGASLFFWAAPLDLATIGPYIDPVTLRDQYNAAVNAIAAALA